MSSQLLLVPASAWRVAKEQGWPWGLLNLRVTADVITICHVWNRDKTPYAVSDAWLDGHITKYADIRVRAGVWYRVDPFLHVLYDELFRRANSAISAEYFQAHVPQGWLAPGPTPMLVVAYSIVGGEPPNVSVWQISRDGATPIEFSVVDDERPPLDFIAGEWPVKLLAERRATLVGVGSIGSAAADVLAAGGVGRLALVDYDRLEQRNLARHQLGPRHLGRLKVVAMAEYLETRFPSVEIERYPLDVVTGADLLRPLFASSDVIICASDGVASRRVVNHLARRATRPLILAAVLEDGAFGEIIRVHPRTGCLYCLRLSQVENGAFDPEPAIDLGYGTGSAHRPMTAAPSDLLTIGSLAAKMSLSTLLAKDRWHQRLPGDYLVMGLQPTPDMPSPFDLDRSGDIRWHNLPPSRPDCPTCAPA